MTKRTTVYILRLGAQILCVRTNLKHTYDHLLSVTNISMQKKFQSYRTISRKMGGVGETMEFNTPMGVFTLEHHALLMYFEPKELREA